MRAVEVSDATLQRAIESDAYRQELGWDHRHLNLAIEKADGFDDEFGTDTTGVDITTPPKTYVPILPRMFHGALKQIALPYEEYVFVDLGVGKGRAILLASDYPFKRCTGVELAPSHNEVALRNFAKYRSPAQRCTKLDSVCGDATTFEWPNEPLFIHFFQSFSPEILTEVLARLRESLEARPRNVAFFYTQPATPEPLEQCGFLKRRGPQGGPSTFPFIVKDGVYPWALFANFD